jgi:type IV pilus assembly protein PilM
MKVNILERWFPPPRQLEPPALGIDISDQSLKYCRLLRRGQKLELDRYGEKAIPVGVLENGRIRQAGELVKVLTDLRQELKLPLGSAVSASLPEEQAFIVELNLPFMPASQWRESIELQLEEHVPLSVAEIIFDYEIIKPATRAGETTRLSVSVFPKTMAEAYWQALAEAGWWPTGFEIEAQAIVRAIVPPAAPGAFLVVDVGKTRTGFFVIEGGVVSFSSTIGTLGGDMITRSIQKNLNLEYDAAEKLKIAQGLLRTKNNEQLLYALAPLVSVLKDEINKLRNYWSGPAGAQRPPLERLILSGGQATLPGLSEYFAAGVGLPAELADVWTNLLNPRQQKPPLDFNQSQKYATAIGLGLRPYLSHHD